MFLAQLSFSGSFTLFWLEFVYCFIAFSKWVLILVLFWVVFSLISIFWNKQGISVLVKVIFIQNKPFGEIPSIGCFLGSSFSGFCPRKIRSCYIDSTLDIKLSAGFGSLKLSFWEVVCDFDN